jgi:hypothetical protein
VYFIVPIPRSGSYYTIDCVPSRFDYEKPYNQKKDYTMSFNVIDITVLSGVGNDNNNADVVFARDLEGIENIGDVTETEPLKAMRNYLHKIRNMIASNPKMIRRLITPLFFILLLFFHSRCCRM